jgi:hypothetical protein
MEISASDFRSGDRVQVIDREATPEETKKRIFYNHMRGLTGIIRRVYEEEEEVWVDVDRASLPDPVRDRHEEVEKQIRDKWYDSLSGEAQRRLTVEESQLKLRYSILTTPSHLILLERGAEKTESAASETTPARRATTEELNAVEEQFLERARTGKSPD